MGASRPVVTDRSENLLAHRDASTYVGRDYPLCSWHLNTFMSGPSIFSSSVNPDLLSLTRRRHATDQAPKARPTRPVPESTLNKTSGSYTHASAIHDRTNSFRSLQVPQSEIKGTFVSVCSAETEVNMYAPFVSTVLVSASAMPINIR
jgi:hypothetical protein